MPVSFEGKPYRVGSQMKPLYPIGVLASRLTEVLGEPRSTQTIRKWEESGVLPPSIFWDKGRRLYAEEQIETICRVAKECQIKQGCKVTLGKFSEKVTEELRIVNLKLKGL